MRITVADSTRVKVAPRVGAWIETHKRLVRTVKLLSRPVWARGLKLSYLTVCFVPIMSRPVWARGLKPMPLRLHLLVNIVAPRVGAWIETRFIDDYINDYDVAPRVGAWIETSGCDIHAISSTSRPVWARGLKPRYWRFFYFR